MFPALSPFPFNLYRFIGVFQFLTSYWNHNVMADLTNLFHFLFGHFDQTRDPFQKLLKEHKNTKH